MTSFKFQKNNLFLLATSVSYTKQDFPHSRKIQLTAQKCTAGLIIAFLSN